MIKKPIIKPFTNRKLLTELPFDNHFFEEPNITKYPSAFKNYAHIYKVKVLDSKDTSIQLDITMPHVKNLLKDFWTEMKGFKIQLTLRVPFDKKIENSQAKYSPLIYFNFKTKIAINDSDTDGSLETSLQKIQAKAKLFSQLMMIIPIFLFKIQQQESQTCNCLKN